MRSPRFLLSVIFLVSTAVMVTSCGDDPKPPSGRRGRKKKKKKKDTDDGGGDAAGGAVAGAGKARARGANPEEEEYSFNENFSGRDPFRSYLRDFAVVQGADTDPIEKIRTHLEKFDLNELRPMAIITGTAVPKAMVTDPSGMGHVIQPGTRLGRRGGKVVRISTNTIVVRHVDEELGTVKETRIRLHNEEDAGKYRLNVIRHDLEADERARAAAKESVLEGLDVEELLNKDGPSGSGGAAAPPRPRSGSEGGTY